MNSKKQQNINSPPSQPEGGGGGQCAYNIMYYDNMLNVNCNCNFNVVLMSSFVNNNDTNNGVSASVAEHTMHVTT